MGNRTPDLFHAMQDQGCPGGVAACRVGSRGAADSVVDRRQGKGSAVRMVSASGLRCYAMSSVRPTGFARLRLR